MRVLLLGGTGEASRLAACLARDDRFDTTLSLAGVTQSPMLSPVPCRIGGFGGTDGLCAWLRAECIEAVIDATHPYAQRISANARYATEAAGVPLLRIERAPWRPQPGDRWTLVPDADAAAAAIGPVPLRVLLTVGSKSLAAFRAAPQHHYVIRCIDPPDPSLLPPHAELLLARGPFALAAEAALLANRHIARLVSKNSGGDATGAKLAACRNAGIPVVMIDRPDSVSGAAPTDPLAWLLALHRDRPPQPCERGA